MKGDNPLFLAQRIGMLTAYQLINMRMTEGYCVKCREKREMNGAKEVDMKGGRRAMQGICSVCGTKMFKILGKAQ